MDTNRIWLFLLAATLCLPAPFAPRTAGADDAEDPPSLAQFRRKTPSGEYVDPASYFRFHGYITTSHTHSGSGLGTALNATPQILVPGLNSGKKRRGLCQRRRPVYRH